MTGKQYAALQGADSIVSDAYDAGMEYGAITFAKWLSESGYVRSTSGLWKHTKDLTNVGAEFTTEQLYRTFLKQKG